MCNHQPYSVLGMWLIDQDGVDSHSMLSKHIEILQSINGWGCMIDPRLTCFRQIDTDVANHTLIKKLTFIADEVTSNSLSFALLQNIEGMTFEEIFEEIGPRKEETILYCSNAGINCENITQIQTGQFPKCFVYDTNQQIDGHTDEGISNGLRLVLMTGGTLGSLAFKKYSDEVGVIIGFDNTFWPNSADGIKIMINSPGEKLDTDQGIVISPGYSTLIAISGKETIKLPWPYSDCTSSNHDMTLLMESVQKILGYGENYLVEDQKSVYTERQCRSACLQRLICHCLEQEMKHTIPNIEKTHFCGTLGIEETHILLNKEQYNKSDCFTNATQLVSDKCSFVHKLINDMACVKQVKQEFTKKKLSGDLECHCPPACYTYEYIVSTSQSPWPTPGPETQAAYANLVYSSNLDDSIFKDLRKHIDLGYGSGAGNGNGSRYSSGLDSGYCSGSGNGNGSTYGSGLEYGSGSNNGSGSGNDLLREIM